MAILQITKAIGKNIRNYRKKRNLTQMQLADLVDMEKESISRIELGKHNVSLGSLEKFAKVLDAPAMELVREKPVNLEMQSNHIAEMLDGVSLENRDIILNMVSDAVRLCGRK